MDNHELNIKKTYQLAKRALDKGNHPFGALLVLDGCVVATAENTVNTEKDVTRHAELNLVSEAAREMDLEFLSRSILYTSTEPCAMCAGAIFWAGISHVVYGCSAAVLAEIAGGTFAVPCRDLFQYGDREIKVDGPVLESEGVEIHRNFW